MFISFKSGNLHTISGFFVFQKIPNIEHFLSSSAKINRIVLNLKCFVVEKPLMDADWQSRCYMFDTYVSIWELSYYLYGSDKLLTKIGTVVFKTSMKGI